MFVLTIYLIMIFLRFLTERRKQFASALGLLSHRGSVIGLQNSVLSLRPSTENHSSNSKSMQYSSALRDSF